MPQVIVTQVAARGLERCRQFLNEQNIQAAKNAGQTISHYLALLEAEPAIGRPLSDLPEIRELIIPFGSAGYVVLYRIDTRHDAVIVLAFRHQKEAGF